MTTKTLTTTQYSALAELRHRGALVASRHAFADDNTRTFSQRTLDALVDAGHARYEVVYGVPNAPAVASGIVPIDAPAPVPPAPAYGVCVGYDRDPHSGNQLATVNGLCDQCTRRLDRDMDLRALVADWQQRAAELSPDRGEHHENDRDEEQDDAIADTYMDLSRALAAVLDGSPR